MIKKLLPLILIAVLSCDGCSQAILQNNPSPSAGDSARGSIPSSTAQVKETTGSTANTAMSSGKFTPLPSLPLAAEDIPILATPDGSTLFIMKIAGQGPSDTYKGKHTKVLKGETCPLVDIYRQDAKDGQRSPVAKGIPFVETAKLNL